MNTLQTFRFWLAPDPEIPRFKRLQWEPIAVPIADVLMQGIHPWMGPDKHQSLLDAFVERLNAEDAKVDDLVPMGHSHDIIGDGGYVWNDKCRFQRTLKSIQEGVYFVNELTYMELLEIAKARLRERWSHEVALNLAKQAFGSFQELRQFLKSKDNNVKLSSYEDIDGYDLGKILSLEDFEKHDKLLVSEGIPTQNFRLASTLASVADEQGRLRLIPEIGRVSLSVITRSQDPRVCGTHVQWHVARSGKMLTFRPDIGGSLAKRQAAADFAKRWHTDGSALVFQTTMDKFVKVVDSGEGAPSFPSLNYGSKGYPPTATVEVEPSRVPAFHIGKYPTGKCTGNVLRDVLREYGVSMTGNKDELIAKLAKLAANKYATEVPKLDEFFGKHRLLRIASPPSHTADLPILEDLRYLRNLLLTMYALRHLRGNAILEPGHENATYTIEELAQALVFDKVSLVGGFVRVA